MESVERFVNAMSNWVWGPPMLLLLMGTHLFLTIRLRFIQRYVGRAIRLSLQRSREGEGDISHFGALMTALAATIGTGNIVGVATAVAVGGPGAVLWMWLTGVFGMATKYGEAVLAVKYRTANSRGEMAGGPMYVLERGLKLRWLGMVFAFLTAVAAFGIGNMVQANSISVLLRETLEIPQWVSGVVLMTLTALVILGGIRSIARVCAILVPFMVITYVGGCLVLLALGWSTLPATIALIAKSAVTGQAAAGGFLGAGVLTAMRYGVARGLFSNESGLGSAPIVATARRPSGKLALPAVGRSPRPSARWDTSSPRPTSRPTTWPPSTCRPTSSFPFSTGDSAKTAPSRRFSNVAA